MSQMEQHSLGTRTARGMLWAFGSYAGGRLLVLIATAVLARLLTPEDFGLVALALTFTAVLEGLSSFGLGQALVIQREEKLGERVQTAFVWSIVFGFAVSALIAALSPLIARFFDEPRLVGITIALGANFFLGSLGITHYSLAQRNLDFRSRTIAEFADVVVRGVAGIGLALAGFGAWSLVIGYLVGTMALNVAIWVLVPWRPKLRWHRDHLPELLRFGGTLSAVDVTAAVGNGIDNVFVGRVLGPAALGFYSIAFTVPNLTVVNVAFVAQKVLFPAFALHDRRELSKAFLITTRYLWLLALPAAIVLAVLAHPLVLVAFGDQWGDAAVPMQILAIYGFALATSFAAGTVYKSIGRAGVVLALAATRLVLLLGALFLFVDFGISAVAACQAGSVGAIQVLNIAMVSRLLGVRLREVWRQVWPCIAAGAAMAVPLVVIERFIADPWLAVISGGIVGAAVYLGVLLAIAPDAIHYIRGKLLPRPSAQPAAG